MPHLKENMDPQNPHRSGRKHKAEEALESGASKKKCTSPLQIVRLLSERNGVSFSIDTSKRPPTVLKNNKQGAHASAYVLHVEKIRCRLPDPNLSEHDVAIHKAYYDKIVYDLRHLCDLYKVYFETKSQRSFQSGISALYGNPESLELIWLHHHVTKIDESIKDAIEEVENRLINDGKKEYLVDLFQGIKFLLNTYLCQSNRLPYGTFLHYHRPDGESGNHGAGKVKPAMGMLRRYQEYEHSQKQAPGNKTKALNAMLALLDYPKVPEPCNLSVCTDVRTYTAQRNNDLDLAVFIVAQHLKNIFDCFPKIDAELRGYFFERFAKTFASSWDVPFDVFLRKINFYKPYLLRDSLSISSQNACLSSPAFLLKIAQERTQEVVQEASVEGTNLLEEFELSAAHSSEHSVHPSQGLGCFEDIFSAIKGSLLGWLPVSSGRCTMFYAFNGGHQECTGAETLDENGDAASSHTNPRPK